MIQTKEKKIIELWEDHYREYVKKHFLTPLEAFKMISNELGIYIQTVEKKLSK